MNAGASPPLRIGPYRLEERLGAGGMGEVYRAWDERLDRWVALKVIRPDAAVDDRARERFRREARAAAGLNHPAIVQIYDILLDSSEGDVLVFELVAGVSLARLVKDGPLSPARVVRLGLELAEGLAVAHARGIIHRDLKAENILVTPEGHAKILDFGVAKSLLEGDPSLSMEGMVVGTYRAMSPEQARGQVVDGRSDLFALGSLFYEMATGTSPFLAGSAYDTLTRICTYRQPSVHALVPEVPETLSRLIDQLLEKDVSRRPQGALEVVAALDALQSGLRTDSVPAFVPAEAAGDGQTTWVDGPHAAWAPGREARSAAAGPSAAGRRRWLALAGVALGAALLTGLAFLWWRGREPRRIYVAVPQPETGERSPAADLAASGLRAALLRGLLGLEAISPLAPEQVDPVSGSPIAIARAVAADEVLTAHLDCAGGICRVALHRILGRDGSLLWTQSFEVPASQPYQMAEATDVHLRQGYAERRVRRTLGALAIQPQDYAAYLSLRRRVEVKDRSLSPEAAIDELEAIRRRAPRFLETYVLEAGLLRNRFHDRRDPADLERASAILSSARQMAPADPRPLAALFDVALRSDHLEQAEEVLASLSELQPGDPDVSLKRAQLLERRGSPDRALALLRETVAQRPSWNALFAQADMEFRLGQGAAARKTLTTLLGQFPGYYTAESLLAQVELQYGDPQRAVQIYTRLVARSPQVVDLANLGTTYLLLGRFAEAETQFRRALATEPENPFVGLNLADALLLQGKREEAARRYQELLGQVEHDPLAGSWQLLSVRAQALAHLGRRREAVETAQRILLLTPGNAQATLEVAIVYSLVGDQASALVNSEQALDQGVEPRWFSFPWFDPLRGSPEFQALLRKAGQASAAPGAPAAAPAPRALAAVAR